MNASQWRGCGTRVPARKREQAASERPVACAISAREKASSFGVTSRGNQTSTVMKGEAGFAFQMAEVAIPRQLFSVRLRTAG
jgi:hypothetical protein